MTILGLTLTAAQLAHATGTFTTPPWQMTANQPPSTSYILPDSTLNTTVVNLSQTCYCGSYAATALDGSADWMGPWNGQNPLVYSLASVSGNFPTLSTNPSGQDDYAIEFTLYFWFQNPQTGKQCYSYPNNCFTVTNVNWFDVEIKLLSYRNNVNQGIASYIGISGSTSINFRETLDLARLGQNFSLTNFDITNAYATGLNYQGLPPTTQAYLVGFEVGSEGYGVQFTTIFTSGTLSNGGGGGCSPSKLLGPPHC